VKEISIEGRVIRLEMGDITSQDTDAIVNAANSRLAGGGGVDGAIHRAGGPDIMAECDLIRKRRGGCPTGEAVATTAGKLKASHVIHTAGPVWNGGEKGEEKLLASCYSSSLDLADRKGCRSVAFPSISTGAYRYPLEKAAPVALRTVAGQLPGTRIQEVRFVLFSPEDFKAYSRALDELEA